MLHCAIGLDKIVSSLCMRPLNYLHPPYGRQTEEEMFLFSGRQAKRRSLDFNDSLHYLSDASSCPSAPSIRAQIRLEIHASDRYRSLAPTFLSVNSSPLVLLSHPSPCNFIRRRRPPSSPALSMIPGTENMKTHLVYDYTHTHTHIPLMLCFSYQHIKEAASRIHTRDADEPELYSGHVYTPTSELSLTFCSQ